MIALSKTIGEEKMRLTNEIRDTTIAGVMEDWDKNNPESAIQEEVNKLVIAAWRGKYGKVDFSAVPKDFYQLDGEMCVGIENEGGKSSYTIHARLSKEEMANYPLPGRRCGSRPAMLVYGHKDRKIAKYLKMREEVESRRKKRNVFEAKIKGVVYAATTDKRLLGAWPEAKKYLPKQVSAGVTALSIDVKALNDELGIKTAERAA